ncbi:MAG: hypothetical protein AAGJ83_12665, partial [Planctomycetota bacterium]
MGRRGGIFSVDFSADGKMIATAGTEGLNLWNAETGELIRSVRRLSTPSEVRFAPERHLVTTGCQDGTIQKWDTRTGECVETLTGHVGLVFALCYTSGGDIVSGSYDQSVRVWKKGHQTRFT